MLPSCYDKKGEVIDFYAIFNLAPSAGLPEVQAAFRALVKRYHPDTSNKPDENLTEKLDLIIRGYRILADEGHRIEYDRLLFASSKRNVRGDTIISKKRIKYSATLGEMLKARLLPKGMKRKDIIYNFGQDIEIFVTMSEARRGAVAYLDLPARMICPLCRGNQSDASGKCRVCSGVGRIHTTSQLEVRIPPHVDESTYIDVDLMKIRPDKMTGFTMKTLRIKISLLDGP